MIREPPQPRVVLAEDDDDLRLLLTRRLEEAGLEVIELEDGFELADYLSMTRPGGGVRMQPDLVISDVRMPGRTGLEAIAQARELGLRCPVVLLTAFADAEVRAEAARLGACLVMEKPVDLDHLAVVLRTLRGQGAPASALGGS